MGKDKRANRYSPEIRARAVRMMFGNQGSYESQAAMIEAIVPKIRCAPQTLNEWVKKVEVDTRKRGSITTEHAEKMKTLEGEVRELRQANEILKKASALTLSLEPVAFLRSTLLRRSLNAY